MKKKNMNRWFIEGLLYSGMFGIIVYAIIESKGFILRIDNIDFWALILGSITACSSIVIHGIHYDLKVNGVRK